MDFSLTEEQQLIKNTIRDFVQKECPDKLVRDMEAKHKTPYEIFNKLGDLGVCGLTVSPEYGGTGPNLTAALIVYEELARQWPALSWMYCLAAIFAGTHILDLGNDRQKKKILPQVAKGRLSIAYAVTEPNAGSDLSSCQTIGTIKDDEFIIKGQKVYITGADYADYFLTLVKTGNDLPNREAFTMFLIDPKTPGIETRHLEKLGFQGISACEIFFNDVRVPRENILGGTGKFGKGWDQVLHTLVTERLQLTACGLGIAQGALDKALSYARERMQFGQPIIDFQAISHKLAEMATEVEAARCLLYYAVLLKEQGKPCHMESSMAKLFTCNVARRNAEQGVLIAGGHGYMMESEMQRYYRDSIAVVVGGGTPEIQKNAISSVLRKRFS